MSKQDKEKKQATLNTFFNRKDEADVKKQTTLHAYFRKADVNSNRTKSKSSGRLMTRMEMWDEFVQDGASTLPEKSTKADVNSNRTQSESSESNTNSIGLFEFVRVGPPTPEKSPNRKQRRKSACTMKKIGAKEEKKTGENTKRKKDVKKPSTKKSQTSSTYVPEPVLYPQIRRQVEYYLSDANLKHDSFYRDKILSSERGDGWLCLSYIMTANRIQSKGCTAAELLEALERSTEVETLVDGENEGREERRMPIDIHKTWIRRRGGRKLPPFSKKRKNDYSYLYTGRKRSYYGGWNSGRSYSYDNDDHYDDDDDDDDQWDGGILGFSSRDCDALLEQGVKPWDDDAGAVLGAIYGNFY